MFEEPSLSSDEKRFMEELYRQADGDTSKKVETASVGQSLGLEKQDASRLSEELIGKGLVEIRTLSGAIALTDEGAELFNSNANDSRQQLPGLGNGPLLDDSGRLAVETLLAEIKSSIFAGADFELLAAVISDIRSAEAQLSSPRPWTAVVRSALEALSSDLKQAARDESVNRLEEFLQR